MGNDDAVALIEGTLHLLNSEVLLGTCGTCQRVFFIVKDERFTGPHHELPGGRTSEKDNLRL